MDSPLRHDDMEALKAAANEMYLRLSLACPNGAVAHEKANIMTCLTRITDYGKIDPSKMDYYWGLVERARKFLDDLESGRCVRKRVSASDLIDDVETIRKV